MEDPNYYRGIYVLNSALKLTQRTKTEINDRKIALYDELQRSRSQRSYTDALIIERFLKKYNKLTYIFLIELTKYVCELTDHLIIPKRSSVKMHFSYFLVKFDFLEAFHKSRNHDCH